MPLADNPLQLEVGVEFYLNSFISMNEVDATISIMGSMLLNWTNSALQWESWSFDNLLSITIAPSDIWTPPMFLANGVEEMEPIENVLFYSTVHWTCLYKPRRKNEGEVSYKCFKISFRHTGM